MLRTDAADALLAEHSEDGCLFPDYDGYCLGNVPHTVTSVLGCDTGRTLPADALAGVATDVGTVLVVLVDGFGFEQWRRERDCHAFLDRLSAEARVTPLTSIYPSETAAAMNTFHSGSLPAEHGVIGWNVYEPTADESFEALPFVTKDGERPARVAPEDVANATSLYTELADAGVACHHVVPFKSTSEGATAHTYESLDGFPERLRDALDAARDEADSEVEGGGGERARSYCFAYLDHVDHAAHHSGTNSTDYRETVGEVFDTLSKALSALDRGVAEDTLLVVTADHGHVNTDPERNVNLDDFDTVLDSLRRHADGTPVRFSGSPRNVHLHLQDGRDAEVESAMRENLDAQVFSRAEVLDRDLFGDVAPSETFRRRLGDVVVSHRDLSVWYGDAEPEEMELIGMHGGLNPEEMLIPFAVGRVAELVN
ncbi:alkaline phosphatase family protein [Halorussus amylolyticus]|uniref:alkaline phosphatase family protein n=1 Tax=Halorussus amylolyticus TaxID=1126242 RepID=UPI0010432775|nr:nucleotide pyrophosphatase/phosphodiesterase family protein [Halorussus amylolyticus]